MITLKKALSLPKEEILEFKKDLVKEIKAKKHLGAYIEQFTGTDIVGLDDSFVPIAIKDNIAIKDWDMTCSSNILQGYKSPYNATVIDNMMNSNMTPFGRCNMDEFAMGGSTETSWYGRTLNPINESCVPGGSSGGSAAAVAGGIAIAALGSDTGGSVRQPAAFCGCVGMKPTYGRVSRLGLTAFSSSLDQIGPLAQNVEDAAILYDAISGYDAKDSTSADVDYTPTAPNLDPNQKYKIAVIQNYLEDANPQIVSKTKEAIKILENAGHEIVYKSLTNSQYDVAAYYVLATAEASTNLSRFDGVRYGNRVANPDSLSDLYKMTREQGFGDEVKRRILLGTFVLSSGYYDAYYIKAQKTRQLIKKEYEEILSEADLILTPVTPTTAFEFDSVKDPLEMYLGDIYTIAVNLAGLPAISLPIGKDDKNLPIGVQLIAGAYQEQILFNSAASLEREII